MTQDKFINIWTEHETWITSRGKYGKQADLTGQDLTQLDLHRFIMNKAKLYKNDLTNTWLGDASLKEVSLVKADLNKARLIKTDLTNADLTEANLKCAEMSLTKLKNTITSLKIPILEKPFTKILNAIQSDGCTLDMTHWHKCSTNHCLAGWTVHLCGNAGYDLEAETSTSVAAAFILTRSSPHLNGIAPNFHTTDGRAMRLIKRIAALEAID